MNKTRKFDRIRHFKGLLLLAGALLLLAGCTDADRAVVVNGMSGTMSVIDLGVPPQVTDNFGGLTLGPSANHVTIVGQVAYVVNSGTFGAAENASVQVIDLASGALLRTIPLHDGDDPWSLAVVNPAKAYVTNLYGDSITIINPALGGEEAILGTIALPEGSAPEGILVVGNRAYTANTGFDSTTYAYGPATVSVIDTTTDTVIDTDNNPANGEDTPISISGLNPQDLAADAEGNLWVVCTGDWFSTFGVVDIIDPVTLAEVDSIATGGSPGSIALNGRIALIGNGSSASLFAIDIATRKVLLDAENPMTLTQTEWSFVPDVVFDRTGQVAFALAFQDDIVFELLDFNGRLQILNQYKLAAGSGPSAIALQYP